MFQNSRKEQNRLFISLFFQRIFSLITDGFLSIKLDQWGALAATYLSVCVRLVLVYKKQENVMQAVKEKEEQEGR